MRSVVCKLCPWSPHRAALQGSSLAPPAFLSSYKYLAPAVCGLLCKQWERGRGTPLHRLWCSPKEGEPNLRAHLG